MTLSQSDLIMVHGEPRVTCRRLGEALGFARIDHLHRLVRTHQDELRDFGEVFPFEGENPYRKGGRPQKGYYFNERQSVALTMWAGTTKAREVRRLIVEVFTAWRQGGFSATERKTPVQPTSQMHEISADRLIELLQSENELLRQQAARPKRKRKPQTTISDTERQEILRLIRAGLSLSQIARVTGRSTASISMMRSGLRVIEGGRNA